MARKGKNAKRSRYSREIRVSQDQSGQRDRGKNPMNMRIVGIPEEIAYSASVRIQTLHCGMWAFRIF